MKKQSDKLNKIVKKNGGVLCDLAKISALSIDSVCRFLYYEPREPENVFCKPFLQKVAK